MSVFINEETMRPSFTAQRFFGMSELFRNRKTSNLITVLKNFSASYPTALISQIDLYRNICLRWEQMLMSNHAGLSPNHFVFKRLCLSFYLYNSSSIRSALNLPKLTLPSNQLELFEEDNFLRTIFSGVEHVFLDPIPNESMDMNSLIISSLSQEPNPEHLLSFLSRVPVRDPVAIISGYANYLEADHQESLIRLLTDKEIACVLAVFSEDFRLRARIFRIKHAIKPNQV